MRACCVLGPVAGAEDAGTNKIDQEGAGETVQLATFLHSIPRTLVRRPGVVACTCGPGAGAQRQIEGHWLVGLAYMANSGPARNPASKINE